MIYQNNKKIWPYKKKINNIFNPIPKKKIIVKIFKKTQTAKMQILSILNITMTKIISLRKNKLKNNN